MGLETSKSSLKDVIWGPDLTGSLQNGNFHVKTDDELLVIGDSFSARHNCDTASWLENVNPGRTRFFLNRVL